MAFRSRYSSNPYNRSTRYTSAQIEMANRILTFLQTHRGNGSSYLSTSRITEHLGKSREDQADVRNVLNALLNANVVRRSGVQGSHSWRIHATSWDGEMPFKTWEDENALQEHVWLAGNTFLNRDKIKSYGGRYVENTHGRTQWRMPLDQWNKHSTDLPGVYLEERVEAGNAEEENVTTAETINETSGVQAELRERIKSLETSLSTAVEKALELDAQTKALQEQIKNSDRKNVTIKIEKYDGTKKVLKNKTLPANFQKILSLAKCRRNILLVGPAGCGKSYTAQLIAETLDMDFGTISGSAGITETHLMGSGTPNLTTGDKVYQQSSFVGCFEKGGVFLFDEIDGFDPNVILCINSALANGYANIPNRPKKPKAIRHPDFICIATANTAGRGATRSYSGRNALDESTLDRFRIGTVECDYDPVVEEAVCPNDELRTLLQNIRRRQNECGLTKRIMSTRFMEDAHLMTSTGGWTIRDVLETYFQTWSNDELVKVRDHLVPKVN